MAYGTFFAFLPISLHFFDLHSSPLLLHKKPSSLSYSQFGFQVAILQIQNEHFEVDSCLYNFASLLYRPKQVAPVYCTQSDSYRKFFAENLEHSKMAYGKKHLHFSLCFCISIHSSSFPLFVSYSFSFRLIALFPLRDPKTSQKEHF